MSSVLQTKVSNAIAALERNMAVLDSTIDDLDDHSNGAFAAFKASITNAVRVKLSDSTINLLIARVAMKRFEEGV